MANAKYTPWTDEWLTALSETPGTQISRTTRWHLDSLRRLGGERITKSILDAWIEEGKRRSTNYMQPRLTLSAKIARITRRINESTYLWFEARKENYIRTQVAYR